MDFFEFCCCRNFFFFFLKATGSSALCTSYISVLDLLHRARCNTAMTHPVLQQHPAAAGKGSWSKGKAERVKLCWAADVHGAPWQCLPLEVLRDLSLSLKFVTCRVLHAAQSLGLSLSTECFVPQKSRRCW